MTLRNIGKYYVIHEIQKNGENANVYLVKNNDGDKFILKEFNKRVMPFIGYAKYNHYGRRREGAWRVYKEIELAAEEYSFLVKFYERFRWNKKWCIIIEYVEGETLGRFIEKNIQDIELLRKVIESFAKEVAKWHLNGFAHGDPHLYNVIVERDNNESLKLIDYSQIHNEIFYCCERFNCFENINKNKRFEEDLANNSKLGKGFLKELKLIKQENEIGLLLAKIFEDEYRLETKNYFL